jgi:hypothetical protein
MKKKLDQLTLAKLIYTIELVVIASVFLVIGILELCKIILINETHRNIFTWITIFGGSYIVFDAIWTFLSKKKQEKTSLFDKITTLPIGLYLIGLDIYGFTIMSSPDTSIHQILVPVAFIYIFVIYVLQAIYHWKHPIPGLLEDEEDDKIDNSQLIAGEPSEPEEISLAKREDDKE